MKAQRMHKTNRHNSDSDMYRKLRFKLGMIASDAVKGTYDYRTRTHKPGTGRPWIQVQKIRVNGIDGFALIDGFDYQNQEYLPLTPDDVIAASAMRCGLFATAESPRKDDYAHLYLTNYIEDMDSLDRLRFDIAELFDLSLFVTWKEDVIQPEILPNCRCDYKVIDALEKNHKFLIHRIGTENDFRKVLQFGTSIDETNTFSNNRFTREEKNLVAENLGSWLASFTEQAFDAGVRWGSEADTSVSVEEPCGDMSQVADPASLDETRQKCFAEMDDAMTSETELSDSSELEMESSIIVV